MPPRDLTNSWNHYDKRLQSKLKESRIITDAIRNMRERHYDKETAQKISGAPYEVVDRIYAEKEKHDTAKRHSEDD